MSYDFQPVERSYGGGYYGASVKNTGLYLTKSLLENTEFSSGDRVLFEVDKDNNAFRVTKDESGWKITNTDDESGATIGSGTEQHFFEEVDLEYGRYEPVKESKDMIIFEHNPDL